MHTASAFQGSYRYLRRGSACALFHFAVRAAPRKMAVYKGVEFPSHVFALVRHMESLNDHRESLTALRASWDTLSLLGQLSNLRTDMGEVRASFEQLTSGLLQCLAEETLARTRTGLGYKAQIAVDILTRNLFERTADIGFLATDVDIVAACASRDSQKLAALQPRLQAYARSYSVYKDIILLDTTGAVLARMKPGFDGMSGSPVVREALHSGAGYVETYAQTDFCGGRSALTYAHRVQHGGQTLGVLALEFDLQTEAGAIFGRLCTGEDLVAFLDADNRVLLSNDELRLPAGYRLALREDASTIRLGGQPYVVSRRHAHPYQGYAGPGWSAVALLPADVAFESREFGHAVSGATYTGERIFSPRLLAVPRQARQIRRRLDRLVWNGRLQQVGDRGNAFSRSVLQEIASTGRKTQEVFETASAELLDTVAEGLVDEVKFLCVLGVDILERNLYERANDCRWWAASPVLAAMQPEASRDTLRYIHSLYTVYTDLLLFDAEGRVVASSASPQLESTTLDAPWATQCLAMRGDQGYAVSSFEASEFYGGRPTFVYAAPVLKDGKAIGGVGIVFDSAVQLPAMLEAALPAHEGAVAAFIEPSGLVLCASGALPTLPKKLLGLAKGETWAGVLVEDGQCYTVGAAAGSGYREFKNSDGHAEGVIGVVVVPCGAVAEEVNRQAAQLQPVAAGEEVATFLIGEHLLGIAANEVVECIEVPKAVRLPRQADTTHRHVGMTTFEERAIALLDLSADMGEMSREHRHAIVLRHEEQTFGLLVTELGAIVELEFVERPGLIAAAGGSRLVTRLARGGGALVPVISSASVLSAAGAELQRAMQLVTQPGEAPTA